MVTGHEAEVKAGLMSIPTLSISTDFDKLFGSKGVYDEPEGRTRAEQPVSIELIDPAHPGTNDGVFGLVEGQSHDRMKRSLRLSFKPDFGGPSKWETDLLKNAPLNGATAPTELDNLVLRAGNNRSWARNNVPATLTEDEWGEIWASSPRYGWCLVEPREGYRPPESAVREAMRIDERAAVQLPTGSLSLEKLTRIFATLPVDLTFVDTDDRVAFFSEGPERVFARSKAIIGRKVQHCHPPRSVEVVDRILDDFRTGRQSVAEFWIEFQGRFVHIRYFAVRGGEGQYLGTLEVTQDATRLRALEGERRLLQYEEAR